jgi:hypothetical protein
MSFQWSQLPILTGGPSTVSAAGAMSGAATVSAVGSSIAATAGTCSGSSSCFAISNNNVIVLRAAGGSSQRSKNRYVVDSFSGRDPDKLRQLIEREKQRKRNNAFMVIS